MSRLDRMFNIEDLRRAAKRRLPRGVFEYVDRGAEDEVSLRRNRAAFEAIGFRPRVLLDMGKRSQETTLFGKAQPLPFAIAPMSPTGLLWFEGELELAKAAAAMGIPFSLPTYSLTPMERIASEAGGRLWFQLYVWQDRAWSDGLMERAQKLGCEALIVTVDTCVGPNREYNWRNGMTEPFRPALRPILDMALHPFWLARVLGRYALASGVPLMAHHPDEHRYAIFRPGPDERTRICAKLDWADIKRFRKKWKGPLIIKGILRADDAKRAVDLGADGIVVSNHGARNLDGALASIEALPEIADAVGAKATILLDSGIRRGADVAKVLALGGHGVLVGRAALWGLTLAGREGVEHALTLLAHELDTVMAYLGCSTLEEIGRELVTAPERNGAVRRARRAAATVRGSSRQRSDSAEA
jgi:(S)-mandelate dehydrogenase